MIKEFIKKAKTDEEYRKKLIAKNQVNILLCIVGAVSIIVAVVRLLYTHEMQESFTCGVFAGTGGAIMIASGGAIRKTKKLLKDAKLLRKERLKETDERNNVIQQKTTYLSSTILLVVCYLALLISCFFNMTVFWTIWSILMLYFILTIFSKKFYEKQL